MGMLGFTFGFGARDIGLKSSVESTISGMDRLKKSVDGQAKSTESAGGFWDNMRKTFDSMNIGTIAQEFMKDSSNLTNGLEDFAMEADKAMRPVLAKAGMLGPEFAGAQGQISSFAYATKRDAASVAESFVAIARAPEGLKKTLKEMGIDFKDLAAYNDVLGISGEQLTGMIGQMSETFGMTGKQVNATLDNVTALSQAAGIGDKIWGKYQSVLDGVSEGLRLSGMENTPENVAKLQDSIVRLSGAMRENGNTADESIDASMAVFNSMASEAKNYQGMIAGLGNDFGPLVTRMSEFTDLNSSLDLMKSDPLSFVSALQKMRNGLEAHAKEAEAAGIKNGQYTVALRRLDEQIHTVNPTLYDFTKGGVKATESLDKMKALAPETGGAFAKMAKQGFRAALSLQEQMDKAKLGMESALRGVARADVKKFVARQITAYAEMGKSITELGKDEVWGGLVKRFSAVQQLGLIGLFAPLGEQTEEAAKSSADFAAKFSFVVDLFQQMAPMMAPIAALFYMIQSTGIVGFLTSLAAPLTAFVGGLGALPIALGAVVIAILAWNALPDNVKKIIDSVIGKIAGFGEKIVEYMKTIDGKKIADSIVSSLRTVANTIISFFNGGFDSIEGSMSPNVKKLADVVINIFKEAFRIAKDTIIGLLTGLFTDPAIFTAITAPLLGLLSIQLLLPLLFGPGVGIGAIVSAMFSGLTGFIASGFVAIGSSIATLITGSFTAVFGTLIAELGMVLEVALIVLGETIFGTMAGAVAAAFLPAS